MSSDGSALWDDAEEAENNVERTPRDEARHGPVRPQELLPRGPPTPEPVCWSAASGSADQSRDAMGNSGASGAAHAEGSDSDSEPARRWPVLRENGTDLRIQGPHLPCGRFERTPSRSASDDHDDDSIEDASSTSHDRQGDDRADAISETWSETSLALDGPSLDTAQQFLMDLYKLELSETSGASDRSQAASRGALRRKLNQCDWARTQIHAKARLTEGRRQRWLDFEFRATHERRPRRRQRSDS